MNHLKQLLLATLLLAVGLPLNAQKKKLKEGDFTELQGQRSVKIEFDYSTMSVGKYDKEEDYLNDKVKDKNKDEPGSGDKWRQAWIDDRENRFELSFLELFNKNVKKKKLKGTFSNDSTKYTLLVKTVHTEPGYNIGITRKDAMVNLELYLHETGSDQILALMEMKKCKGKDAFGFDFDTAKRLEEAYAKAGKEFGKYLSKKVLKEDKKNKKRN